MKLQNENEIYQGSWTYEDFVTLSREQSWGAHDAKNTDMEIFMLSELGATHVRHLKKSKLRTKVKLEMIGALKFALKRELPPEVKVTLRNLSKVVKTAEHSEELLSICREGITALLPYKKD